MLATTSGSGLEGISIVAGDGGAESSKVIIGTSNTTESGDEGGVNGAPPTTSGGGPGQRPRHRFLGGSQHRHPSEDSSYASDHGLDPGDTPARDRPSP